MGAHKREAISTCVENRGDSSGGWKAWLLLEINVGFRQLVLEGKIFQLRQRMWSHKSMNKDGYLRISQFIWYVLMDKFRDKRGMSCGDCLWPAGFVCVLQPFKDRQVHSEFGQMAENSRSCGDAWQAFIQGWDNPCTPQATCCTWSPNSLTCTQCTQSQQGAQILYSSVIPRTRAHSQGYGNTAYLSCPGSWVRDTDCIYSTDGF